MPRTMTVIEYLAEQDPPDGEAFGGGAAGVLLCPRFASLAAWELAARQQQVRLLFEVRQ